MPYTQTWLAENAVILVEYEDDMMIDDIAESAEELLMRLNRSNRQLVHTIYDMTNVGAYPTKLADLNRVLKPLMTHHRMGWILFYGQSNPIIEFLMQMVAQISKVRFRTFETYDEARKFIQQIDSTLPELPETV